MPGSVVCPPDGTLEDGLEIETIQPAPEFIGEIALPADQPLAVLRRVVAVLAEQPAVAGVGDDLLVGQHREALLPQGEPTA